MANHKHISIYSTTVLVYCVSHIGWSLICLGLEYTVYGAKYISAPSFQVRNAHHDIDTQYHKMWTVTAQEEIKFSKVVVFSIVERMWCEERIECNWVESENVRINSEKKCGEQTLLSFDWVIEWK